MKKLFVFIISLLFIPVVYAKSDIEIESITMDSKSENTVEKTKPVYNGLDMNYDVSFKKTEDFIKYKVVIKNNTDNDFVMNIKDAFEKKDFVTYNYEGSEDLKANDTATVFVTITYATEVAPGSYVSGKYNDLNKITIEVLNATKENPNTKTGIIMFAVLGLSLLLFGVSVLIYKNKTLKYFSIILLFGGFVVPFVAKALDKYIITINTKVEIERTYKVMYSYIFYGYYTASEIAENNYDCSTGSAYHFNGHDEDYYECHLRKDIEDPNRYYAGERVEVLKPSQVIQRCSTGSFYEKTCTGELEIYNMSDGDDPVYFNYAKIDGLENENVTMNFTYPEIYDVGSPNSWNVYGHVTVPSGAIFTMPAHDVLFYQPDPH